MSGISNFMSGLLSSTSQFTPGMAVQTPGNKSDALSTASSTATTSTSTNAGSQFSSSDFLTLLVSELKNQDPTQPTDPSQYVQQLVGVNSLEQLISINQELGGSGGTTTQATGTAAIAS